MDEKTKRVEATRLALRKHEMETILNQYDAELLGLSKENQKEKYGKMLHSPFQFYRGSAYLFYFDVMRMPLSYHTSEDKPTWLQGDLHFENFGAFMDKKGDLVYDTNDFDEGYLGSYLHDVLRMAASIALFAEELNYGEEVQKQLIQHYVKAYYEQLQVFAAGDADPGTFVFRKSNTSGPVKIVLADLESRGSEELLEETTTVQNGKRQFILSDKMESLSTGERMALEEAWPQYIESLDKENERKKGFFAIKDVVKKHGSGTGSIGLQRYYILVEGEKNGELRDDIVLEAKEARAPVPAHFFSYDLLFGEDELHQGQRVIMSQKAMQYLEDPFLGYFTLGDHHFYVRENSPYVGEVGADELGEIDNMKETVEIMGNVTAKMHARADIDAENEALSYDSEKEILKAIDGDMNGFVSEIILWSLFYKHQVHEDFRLFGDWCNKEFGLNTKVSEVQ